MNSIQEKVKNYKQEMAKKYEQEAYKAYESVSGKKLKGAFIPINIDRSKTCPQ